MKKQLARWVHQALLQLQQQQVLPAQLTLPQIMIERPRQEGHGDFSCAVALELARAAKCAPRAIADQIVAALPDSDLVQQVTVAGPGFINITLNPKAQYAIVATILAQGSAFAAGQVKKPRHIHLEFVSANPTGPLHVGHGRSAAYGSCIAHLLRDVGHTVECEYYVNDAGRQIQILGLSAWIRYLQHICPSATGLVFPEGAYQGEYIKQSAQVLLETQQDRFAISKEQVTQLLSCQLPENTVDKNLDAMTTAARNILKAGDFKWICDFVLEDILQDIRQDLAEFGVTFQSWFRESELVSSGALTRSLTCLEKAGFVYEKEGARWFRATALGDEKDRVLVRANGQSTYFASDVAYHLQKFSQKYDDIIDIFGADHHGYIARINAFLKALNCDPSRLHILLVQFAILYRGDEKVSMSTRGGDFVTLRTLRAEVGDDAARYFYIMRKPDQHLDFDLELAKSKTNENPVFYIQYAHARICQVFRQAATKEIQWDKDSGLAHLELLVSPHEQELASQLNQFPEVVLKAAQQYAPHLLAHYLRALAAAFHAYYNAEMILVEDQVLCQARLCLIAAVQICVRRGLTLLGLSAPERM